jgi:hypothetical protein
MIGSRTGNRTQTALSRQRILSRMPSRSDRTSRSVPAAAGSADSARASTAAVLCSGDERLEAAASVRDQLMPPLERKRQRRPLKKYCHSLRPLRSMVTFALARSSGQRAELPFIPRGASPLLRATLIRPVLRQSKRDDV